MFANCVPVLLLGDLYVCEMQRNVKISPINRTAIAVRHNRAHKRMKGTFASLIIPNDARFESGYLLSVVDKCLHAYFGAFLLARA